MPVGDKHMAATDVSNSREHDYLNKYWEVLAACAWRECLAHGRGALLVGGFDDPEGCIYLPSGMMANPLLDGFTRLVDEYDPNQEIVVVIMRPPDMVSAYKGAVPERGTPSELYERLKLDLFEQ